MDPNESAYMTMVRAEYNKLVDRGVPEPEARAKAYAKVSRERRDLLEAHNEQLANSKREQSTIDRQRQPRFA